MYNGKVRSIGDRALAPGRQCSEAFFATACSVRLYVAAMGEGKEKTAHIEGVYWLWVFNSHF